MLPEILYLFLLTQATLILVSMIGMMSEDEPGFWLKLLLYNIALVVFIEVPITLIMLWVQTAMKLMYG